MDWTSFESQDGPFIGDSTVVIKGAGEKASAVAVRLYQAGLRKIVMTERPRPAAERRGVTFSEALIDRQKEVEGVAARGIPLDVQKIRREWADMRIGVLADPETRIRELLNPTIIIDAIMAKRNTGASIHDAPLVVALGPGFVAGQDAHYVIETNPNTDELGKVISSGQADTNTGIPTPVLDLRKERLLTAPADGILQSGLSIGDSVQPGHTIAYVGENPVRAGIAGVVWGLMRDGIAVRKDQKIGDIDPRGEKYLCFKITPQARAISCGVLECVFRFFTQRKAAARWRESASVRAM